MIPEPFDYKADWWQHLSCLYREERAWQCEECNISLYKHKQYLHTHHIRGTQYNEPEDLKVLCIGCHSEQPGEGHLRLKKEDYQDFMGLYEVEWRKLRKQDSVRSQQQETL